MSGLGEIEPAPDPGLPYAPPSPAAEGADELVSGGAKTALWVGLGLVAASLTVAGAWWLWKQSGRRR